MFWQSTMFRWSYCVTFLVCLILPWNYLAMAATTRSPTTDNEGDGFDKNLIYVIVGVGGLFLIVVAIICMVSYWQRKNSNRPTRERADPIQFADSLHSQNNAIYEAGNIPTSLAPEWWEIPVNNLKLFPEKVLGSGQYGIVLLGEITKDYEDKKCAIKTVKENATEREKKSLKNELENMSGMDHHPNIVNLIGAQTLYGNFFVVVEYCENGSLYDFLRKHRSDIHMGAREHETDIRYSTRLRIAFDIANGMNYLATKKFVHRDLAARNVLLDGNLRAKISDFGRTRDTNKMFLKGFESVRMKNEPIPTRWMPIETLLYGIFTSKSDVWSYGVLLWEIESGGVRPYDNDKSYHQVVDKVVRQGYRLSKPKYSSDVMYRIMKECWNEEAEKRPTFRELADIFGNLLKGIIATPPTSPTRQDAPIRFIV